MTQSSTGHSVSLHAVPPFTPNPAPACIAFLSPRRLVRSVHPEAKGSSELLWDPLAAWAWKPILYLLSFYDHFIVMWGLSKIPVAFGRIGRLALRPCTLLRAWGSLPHSINILQIPWWYADMDWYGMSCARPCALLRGPAFLMPLYHALKILSPPKMWLKGRGFYKSPCGVIIFYQFFWSISCFNHLGWSCFIILFESNMHTYLLDCQSI